MDIVLTTILCSHEVIHRLNETYSESGHGQEHTGKEPTLNNRQGRPIQEMIKVASEHDGDRPVQSKSPFHFGHSEL